MAVGEAMLELAPVGDGIYRRGYAGDTFNTAWHMAQLLGPAAAVGFVTRIGSDALSEAFAAEMSADGIDISGVSRDAQRGMGLYLIELDGVERSFHYWRDRSAARLLADDPQALARALDAAGLIHLSGITLAILSDKARDTLFGVLADARRAGAIVSFDPNIRPRLWSSPAEIRSAMQRMLSTTDIALPSFDDETAHWNDPAPGDTIERFVTCGVREVVLKNGPGTVHFHADGRHETCETPKVSQIRDTTGAGDAFNAGYLSARLMGCTPRRAIAAGQKLSAEVIGHFGARAPKETVKAMAPHVTC